MQRHRLAWPYVLSLGVLVVGLVQLPIALAQQTRTADEGGTTVELGPRSVIRGRNSAPRAATRLRTQQAPQVPEEVETPSRATPSREFRSRSGAGESQPQESVIPEGHVIDPEHGELVELNGPLDPMDTLTHFDCPLCGGDGCELCSRGVMLGLGGIYARFEYLAWNMSGMDLPPLVTTSPNGTVRAQAGVLGTPGVSILFGNTGVNDEVHSGGRVTLGAWLDACRRNAIEFDFFELDDGDDSFTASSTGNPILARPFFNMLTARESAELVAFPNLITGSVTVDTLTRLSGGGVRLRRILCCGEDCGPSFFNPMPQPGAYRYEVILGYRVVSLDDQVLIGENLTAVTPPGSFVLSDQFRTSNEFHGFDLGMAMQLRRGRWTLDGFSRVAFGNTHSSVAIAGNTQINEGAGAVSRAGGLLAQRSNIGNYADDQFSVVPEIGLTVGVDVTPCLRLFAGYSLLYWSRVARAGDQIDLDLNPNLIPPEAVPFSGPLRPRFIWDDTDFWAYGLNAGIEGRF